MRRATREESAMNRISAAAIRMPSSPMPLPGRTRPFDRIRSLPFVVVTALLVLPAGARAASPNAPIKLVLSSTIGWEVDKTGGDFCAIGPKDECQRGAESGQPGGFAYPKGVAANDFASSPDYHDVYVADTIGNRVQELTPEGRFVRMFGWKVNQTTGSDICTQREIEETGARCGPGTPGTGPGQFASLGSVAIDRSTGNVYVQEEYANRQVDKYTADGRFVWMAGREVNETKSEEFKEPGNPHKISEAEESLCTQQEIETANAKCGGGQGGNGLPAIHGNMLAVGGPEHLVYVGDEEQLQELTTSGVLVREIPLPAGQTVGALALEQTGNVYFATEQTNAICKVNLEGKMAGCFSVEAREPETGVHINAIAIDQAGRLAVSGRENGFGVSTGYFVFFGALYDASTGRRRTEFHSFLTTGVTFTDEDQLYMAVTPSFVGGHELLAYHAVPVAEVLTGSSECKPEGELETSVVVACPLKGSVNPWGVGQTQAWFQWGSTCSQLEEETPKEQVPTGETSVPFESKLAGLRPNQAFCYRIAATDENVQLPELLSGERTSNTTPSVPPKIVGPPTASYITPTSAILFGELNPENAATAYRFQYGPCERLEKCSSLAQTETLESETYGKIGTTLEAQNLQPDTAYRYRLTATNQAGPAICTQSNNCEGTFKTAPKLQLEAVTGEATNVTATTVTISGLANPDGQPATYTFQIGINDGPATQYATLVTAAVPATIAGFIPVAFAVSGLRPGTQYAYRIVVKSNNSQIIATPNYFTTQTQLPLLVIPLQPQQLSIPPIAFPAQPVGSNQTKKCTKSSQNKHHKCAKNGKRARRHTTRTRRK
jgi:hypothetical protein